jgi:hypothetical protein
MHLSIPAVAHLPAIARTRHALVALVAACAACATPPVWQKPTIYVVHDLDEAAKERLARELGATERTLGFTQVFDSDTQSMLAGYLGGLTSAEPRAAEASAASVAPTARPFMFQLTNLKDMNQLRDVQALIQRISDESRVPVKLQRAVMEFASVTGKGRSEIQLSGTATSGARVWLDVGQPTAIEVSVVNGAWSYKLHTSERLLERGGWVYGRIHKSDAVRFAKINVLKPDSWKDIRVDDLPDDCVLDRTP